MTAVLYLAYSIYNRKLVTPMEFMDWLCSLRIPWTIFFSVFGGFFLASYAITDQPMFLTVGGISIVGLIGIWAGYVPPSPPKPIIETVTVEKEIERIVEKKIMVQPKRKKHGVIYILRRSDGVLKFGKTYNLRNRLSQHRSDYKQGFMVTASWVVSDLSTFEGMALDMTRRYQYSEDNRRELRKMTDAQLNEFMLNFTSKVQGRLNQ